MIKDEATFHTTAMRWLKHHLHYFPKSFLIESKVVRRGKKSFPYSELSEKEERLLLRSCSTGIIHTHSDLGGLGTLCDASVISGNGFIFMKWVRPRNKEFFVFEIKKFIKHRNNSKRKSLTEDEAREIAYLIEKHV